MKTQIVIVINTFKPLSLTPEAQIYIKAFETHCTRLCARTINACSDPLVLVSANGGELIRRFALTDIRQRPTLAKISMVPEPGRFNQLGGPGGPTALLVLKSALEKVEQEFRDSKTSVRLLFLTPWYHSQDGAANDDDSDDRDSPFAGALASVARALVGDLLKDVEFILCEMQANSDLSRCSCLARLNGFRQQQAKPLPLQVSCVSASEGWYFDGIFRRVLSWSFAPQPAVLPISSEQFLLLHCALRPATWPAKEWWHSGLSTLKPAGCIRLADVDILRLSSPTSLVVEPASSGGLPLNALRENRSLFAAVCSALARSDEGLLFNTTARGAPPGSTAPLSLGGEEVWLLHVDSPAKSNLLRSLAATSSSPPEPPSSSSSLPPPLNSPEGTFALTASVPESDDVWLTAVLQQVLPPEVVLLNRFHHGGDTFLGIGASSSSASAATAIEVATTSENSTAPRRSETLDAPERERSKELASSVSSVLGALGYRGLDTEIFPSNLFDRPHRPKQQSPPYAVISSGSSGATNTSAAPSSATTTRSPAMTSKTAPSQTTTITTTTAASLRDDHAMRRPQDYPQHRRQQAPPQHRATGTSTTTAGIHGAQQKCRPQEEQQPISKSQKTHNCGYFEELVAPKSMQRHQHFKQEQRQRRSQKKRQRQQQQQQQLQRTVWGSGSSTKSRNDDRKYRAPFPGAAKKGRLPMTTGRRE